MYLLDIMVPILRPRQNNINYKKNLSRLEYRRMKIKKFIYKFIDHDSRVCTEICVKIHIDKHEDHTKHLEASEQKSNYFEWKRKLKEKIKEEISKRHFDGNGFNGYQVVCESFYKKVKKINTAFKKHDAGSFNTSNNRSGANGEPILEIISSKEVCCVKLSKGRHTGDKKDIKSYRTINIDYYFELITDEASNDVQLQNFATVNYPSSGDRSNISGPNANLRSFNTSNLNLGNTSLTRHNTLNLGSHNLGSHGLGSHSLGSHASRSNSGLNQTGGERHRNRERNSSHIDGYTKYKKKYIDLKNNIRNGRLN